MFSVKKIYKVRLISCDKQNRTSRSIKLRVISQGGDLVLQVPTSIMFGQYATRMTRFLQDHVFLNVCKERLETLVFLQVNSLQLCLSYIVLVCESLFLDKLNVNDRFRGRKK